MRRIVALSLSSCALVGCSVGDATQEPLNPPGFGVPPQAPVPQAPVQGEPAMQGPGAPMAPVAPVIGAPADGTPGAESPVPGVQSPAAVGALPVSATVDSGVPSDPSMPEPSAPVAPVVPEATDPGSTAEPDPVMEPEPASSAPQPKPVMNPEPASPAPQPEPSPATLPVANEPAGALGSVVGFDNILRLSFESPVTGNVAPEDVSVWDNGDVGVSQVRVKPNDPQTLEIVLERPLGNEGVRVVSCCNGSLRADGQDLAFEDVSIQTGRELFLLIGQSNMAGRGELQNGPLDALSNVDLFKSDGEWEPAKHPLNKYSTIRKDLSVQQVGPGYEFARVVQQALGKDLGVIVNARGGTKIAAWLPGAAEGYFEAAIRRAILAERSGPLRAILWHQGEGDAGASGSYAGRFRTFAEALRSELDAPELPIVLGQLGTWSAHRDNINAVLLSMPDEVAFVYAVRSNGVDHVGDGTHFSADGQAVMGERFAASVLENVYGDR